MMNSYQYVECGLDNVLVVGIACTAGDEDLLIPNINGLHRAIALGIISGKAMMSGRELRFLRTEMGMTQSELAAMLHREPLTLSRWERAETPLDANAETLIRLLVNERLKLGLSLGVTDLSSLSVPAAMPQQIVINGEDPRNYRLAA